jgi:hypothetical protein
VYDLSVTGTRCTTSLCPIEGESYVLDTGERRLMLSSAQAKRLGADAFVFGFPLLLMAAMRRSVELAATTRDAPLNRFAHMRHFATPRLQTIVGANNDSLYSLAWLDLGAEPLMLSFPDTGERSYLMPLFDAWGKSFASLGPRTRTAREEVYGIVGPNWQDDLPEGVHRLDAPCEKIWTICHLHAEDGDDLEASRAIQRDLQMTALSTYSYSSSSSSGVAAEIGLPTQLDYSVMALKAEGFLGLLAEEMGFSPPAGADRLLIDRFEQLGVRPGQPFSWGELPEETQAALEVGMSEGRGEVAGQASSQIDKGWQFVRERPTSDGGDYLRRARTANFAMGTADSEDAVFPLTLSDHNGQGLNGAHAYTLRFESDALPPAKALWSLALYDMDQLFVDNSIDRYALGSRDTLEFGPSGTLEIAIQHKRPEGSSANWLPAPVGDFNLMLHLYWPGKRALNGGWTPPSVTRA